MAQKAPAWLENHLQNLYALSSPPPGGLLMRIALHHGTLLIWALDTRDGGVETGAAFLQGSVNSLRAVDWCFDVWRERSELLSPDVLRGLEENIAGLLQRIRVSSQEGQLLETITRALYTSLWRNVQAHSKAASPQAQGEQQE